MMRYPLSRKGMILGIAFLFMSVAIVPNINSTSGTLSDKTAGPLVPCQPTFTFLDNYDFFIKVDLSKHLLLFYIVSLMYVSRSIRGDFLLKIAYDPSHGIFKIKHPLLFIRGVWLLGTLDYWESFWRYISDSQGWNWPLPPDFPPHVR